jgi:hypothetical protein
MSATPDLKALAERYLNLWEEQFTAAAADPTLNAVMSAWLESWRGFGYGRRSATTAHAAHPAKEAPDHAAQSSSAGGTAPAGPAPANGGPGLSEILERLDRLERRLAVLERERGGKGRKAGSRRGRSR